MRQGFIFNLPKRLIYTLDTYASEQKKNSDKKNCVFFFALEGEEK